MAKYQEYEEYKDSGVEWFKKIPIGWSYTYVGIVSDVIDPQPDHRAPAISQNGEGFPYIGIRDVNKDGTLNFETARPVEESAVLKQEKSFTIEPHNIIFCKVGTLGIPRKIMPHGRCALSATLVLIKAKKIIDSQFLLYILDSKCITLQTNFLATGSTRAALGIQQIRKFKMPFPTMLEQEKIANFLDYETAKIDTLIEKQQTLIQLLKEKRQAVISHAVTKGLNPDAPMKDSGVEWLGEVPEHWEVGRLKNVLRIRNGRDYKAVEVESGGYPVYGSGGIFKRSSDYLFDGESVLFGRKGTIDKPLLVSGKFWTVDTMFYSEVSNNAKPEYIYHQALLFPFDKLSTNTALPSMTQEDLLNLGFVIPPFDEQKEICQYLNNKLNVFSNLVSKAEQAIQLMQERRTALISAAVTGKIDVRGWRAVGVEA
ncbi:restriction endonuclease subunit S [Psychrobacter immobilis]|uniref:restriction endonuclease subunit S n=1 Tax=Psychrobacter immobilis TaxID=498 RepID=UPI00191AFC47|nr:restriction endonuclease subunit S [Psychrobacter immobilis]